MAQHYSNRMRILGTLEQRVAFLADALIGHSSRGWDRVRIEAEPEVSEEAEGLLHFHSRGFPLGLDALMSAHPEITLVGDFVDLSYPKVWNKTLRNNKVLAESSVEGEEEVFGDPPRALTDEDAKRQWLKTEVGHLKRQEAEMPEKVARYLIVVGISDDYPTLKGPYDSILSRDKVAREIQDGPIHDLLDLDLHEDDGPVVTRHPRWFTLSVPLTEP